MSTATTTTSTTDYDHVNYDYDHVNYDNDHFNYDYDYVNCDYDHVNYDNGHANYDYDNVNYEYDHVNPKIFSNFSCFLFYFLYLTKNHFHYSYHDALLIKQFVRLVRFVVITYSKASS